MLLSFYHIKFPNRYFSNMKEFLLGDVGICLFARNQNEAISLAIGRRLINEGLDKHGLKAFENPTIEKLYERQIEPCQQLLDKRTNQCRHDFHQPLRKHCCNSTCILSLL